VLLGVQPIVAHFFVFYYGVLADITPPVALAAYAAAGMAGSDPFKTGNTAFRLGLGKVLVPFVFVFAPSMLIVVNGFTWSEFFVAPSAACSASRSLHRRCRIISCGRCASGSVAVRLFRDPDDRAGHHQHRDGPGAGDPVLIRQVAAMRRSAAAA
jgi:hypothetical protein